MILMLMILCQFKIFHQLSDKDKMTICPKCGYEGGNARFTYFPRYPQNPLCENCTNDKFGIAENIISEIKVRIYPN